MRIVMMGTGPFAVPTFSHLLTSPHEIVALVTRPVPPAKGRNKSKSQVTNPMRDRALEAGLPIFEPASVNADEFAAQLTTFEADLYVVCDYGQILSRDVLALPQLGGINLHASLLPKYRGAAPINWAIYHGEAETGITVIHMTPKLDGGPCLIQESMRIEADVDAVELEHRLAVKGVAAVAKAIEILGEWDGHSTVGIQQDQALATRAPRLKKQDGLLNWQRTNVEICNHVRAFKPWPATYTFWQHPKRGSLRLTIGDVCVERDEIAGGPPGSIAHVDKQRLVVNCGDGLVSLKNLQPAGKKMQAVNEFLRGYPLQLGDTFSNEP